MSQDACCTSDKLWAYYTMLHPNTGQTGQKGFFFNIKFLNLASNLANPQIFSPFFFCNNLGNPEKLSLRAQKNISLKSQKFLSKSGFHNSFKREEFNCRGKLDRTSYPRFPVYKKEEEEEEEEERVKSTHPPRKENCPREKRKQERLIDTDNSEHLARQKQEDFVPFLIGKNKMWTFFPFHDLRS